METKYTEFRSKTEQFFYGYLANRVVCLHCDYDSWAFDPYSDLIVSIEQNDASNHAKKKEVEPKAFEEKAPKIVSMFHGGGVLAGLSDNEDADEG